MPLLLEIVTPDRRVFCEKVDHVAVPTTTGEIDILPGHQPLLSMVQPGELRYAQDGKPSSMAIDKGFVQIRGDKVSVLAEAAIDVEKIDLTAVEQARKAAEEALEEARKKGEDPAIIEELETKARFSVIQSLIKKH
ncbi:MAG: ATP synthase F1 subunit epsilon [Opitutales bacterium]|nr:ATP synthase F1 subunit epsilon [Opitutales bacterium]